MVAAIVSAAREARIWDLTDAVVAGDERKALASMRTLLEDGQAPQLLLFMLVRQYRQLALIKDLRTRGDRRPRCCASLEQRYRLNTLTTLAARYGWGQIRGGVRALLDADLGVKRGLRDDESSLQLVLHQLCALASRTAPRGGSYARRAGSSSG